VCFSVSDTGVGIGAASLAHIFEPFRQADDGADRRYGGSGLGLAIVRELVQVMGGQIRVTSKLGEGSCFEFELPLPLAKQPPVDAPTAPHRFVFFEPHETSAQALQAQLQRQGWSVQRVTDAAQLRQALLQWQCEPAPWLLLATDATDPSALLEPVAELVEPDRVIGMAHDSTHETELVREHAGLTRQLIKPVTRAALVSCMARSAASGVAVAQRPSGPQTTEAPDDLRHVLLVEDDPINRDIARSMLYHAGYRVSVAHDGEQALQLLPQLEGVDLVLMDWQMPGLDGLEVTRRMRAGLAGAAGLSVPIVALTANAFVEDRAACLNAGMNDFLTKPLLDASLRAMAARWARSRPVRKAQPAPAAAAVTAAEIPCPAATPPVFDASVLAALPMVADGSAPNYASELMAMFLGSAEQTLREVERAVAAADATKLQRLVHTLKSSSASVGALELAECAAAHEGRLRRGETSPNGLSVQLAEAVQRLKQAALPFAMATEA
jgi:CheY-like chemotaxis protein